MFRGAAPPPRVTFEATNRSKLLEHAHSHQVTVGSEDFYFNQSIHIYTYDAQFH